MIEGLTNDGAVPVLEALIRFSGARQRLIAHNAANISTPDYRTLDVRPAEFQGLLRRAIDQRREEHGAPTGPLEFESTDQIQFGTTGSLHLNPDPNAPSDSMLFHDRNNRDIERLMQANAENVAVFRVATDLLRSRMEIMRVAVSERV